MQIIPEKFYGDWDIHCEIFFQNNPADFILSLSLSLFYSFFSYDLW